MKRGRQQTPNPPSPKPPSPRASPLHPPDPRNTIQTCGCNGNSSSEGARDVLRLLGPRRQDLVLPPPPRGRPYLEPSLLRANHLPHPTPPPHRRKENGGRLRTRGEHPIKRSSSAAPTRIRKREGSEPAGTTPNVSPPVSPAPLPRRVLSGSGPISLEDGDPDHPSRPHSLIS